MTRKYSEYVYKNSDDTIRIKIFKRCEGEHFTCEWDADEFYKETGKCDTYSQDAGDYFYSKRDAKSYYEDKFGKLTSIQPKDLITDGWGNW